MTIRLAILTVLLGGCAAESTVEIVTSAPKNNARTCADETVVIVDSISTPAPDLNWSAGDVLQALDDDFEGMIYWEAGGESPAVFDAASRATPSGCSVPVHSGCVEHDRVEGQPERRTRLNGPP